MKCTLSFLLCACLAVPTFAQTLLFDDFEDGDFVGWTIHDDRAPVAGPSDWSIMDGMLMQRSNIWSYDTEALETKYHLGTHAVTGDASWTDYSLNAIVKSNDNDGIGLIVRYQDPDNYYRILLMNDPAWSGRDSSGVAVNTRLQRIQNFVNGEPIILAENKVSEAYPSGFFSLTADVRGDTLRAYVDGAQILQAVDATYPSGRVGVLSYANQGVGYDDIRVDTERLVYSKPDRIATYPVRRDRAPYLQNPTQHSAEIAWRTVVPSVGHVHYSDDKDNLDRTVSEDEAHQKHHVHLDDLEPSTRYYYEVYSGNDRTQPQTSFYTARRDAENAFTFLVLGDSGVDSPVQWQLADQMRALMDRHRVDFVVHVGDVHQGSGDDYDAVYFEPYADIIKNINVFTSLGNHDTYTDGGAVYLDDFYLPHNNPDSTERYYSFRWANAFFIALDTNIDYSPGSPQYRWFESELQRPLRDSTDWTFVYAHHPPYSEYWTNYYGEEAVQNHLMPLFEQYDVDMVMNGHTHSYERGEKAHVHYLVTGGGGGGLDDFFVDHEHIHVSKGAHHFTRIDVDGETLRVEALGPQGERIDRYLVHKRASVQVEPEAPAPDTLGLSVPFPNPARDRVSVRYTIAEASDVRVSLFDLQGRLLMPLVATRQAAGHYTLDLDTAPLAAATYLIRLEADNQQASVSVIVQ
ncbi:MAG: hypothetical protein RhofKO_10810 [Rhodothermales bacterium]